METLSFAKQSKANAVILAARYLDNPSLVSTFCRFNDYAESYVSPSGFFWPRHKCSRHEVIGFKVVFTNFEGWAKHGSSPLEADYYDMVGTADAVPPSWKSEILGTVGGKTTKTVTTVPNPELWCFAPDFVEAVKQLQEQEELSSSSFQSKVITARRAA